MVIACDGLWDVLTNSVEDTLLIGDDSIQSDELVELAYQRWKQEWDFIKPMSAYVNYDNMNTETQKFTRCDDISVCTWIGEISP